MASPHAHHHVVKPGDETRLNGIYNDYRKALMNNLYYECRLDSFKKVNLYYEITLAVGTSGTVAAWYIWQTPIGKTAWPIFGGVVALLSIVKPFLKLPEKIEALSKLHTGYKELFYDLDKLLREIQDHGGLSKEFLATSAEAQERYKQLALIDEKPDEKLLKKSFKEVKERTSPFGIWYQQYIVQEI